MVFIRIFICILLYSVFFSCKHRVNSPVPSSNLPIPKNFLFSYQESSKGNIDFDNVHSSLMLPSSTKTGLPVDWESSHPFLLNSKTGDLKKPSYEPVNVTLTAKQKGKNSEIEQVNLKILGEGKQVCPQYSLVWRDDLCWYISSLILFFYGTHNKVFLDLLWKENLEKDKNNSRTKLLNDILKDIETIISPGETTASRQSLVTWGFQKNLNEALQDKRYENFFLTTGHKQQLNGADFASALALIFFLPEIKSTNLSFEKKYRATLFVPLDEINQIEHTMSYSSIRFDFSNSLVGKDNVSSEELSKIISLAIDQRLNSATDNLSKEIIKSSLDKKFFLVTLANYKFSSGLLPPKEIKVGSDIYFLSNALVRSSIQDQHAQTDSNGHFTNYMRCKASWKYYDSMFSDQKVREAEVSPLTSLPKSQEDANNRIAGFSETSLSLLLYTR